MRPRLLDLFCGEGGAGEGYKRVGFEVVGVDTSAARLKRYPFECHQVEAITYLLAHGHEFDLIHASPPCTGYSAGTRAVPDRLTRYDRLIAATREALQIVGKPYVIENVRGAKSELHNPVLLCGRQFGLATIDIDNTPLVMDRHRLFESDMALMVMPHPPHDMTLQVAGSYGGGRRDKDEARYVRKGGYVPLPDVQRNLLGVQWMTEVGCRLSVPPAYTEFIGAQLLDALARAA